jgi:hypothetical protein
MALLEITQEILSGNSKDLIVAFLRASAIGRIYSVEAEIANCLGTLELVRREMLEIWLATPRS